jgi:YGGT family
MTNEQTDRTVVTQEPAATAGQPTQTATETRRTARTGPGGSELTRRIVVLIFGLIQIVIGLRIVLLLLDARTANGIVSGILNISQVFVAPFNGILGTDYLAKGGSVLDIAAIVAFVGWTILELIVIWALAIFRREPA